MVTRIVCGAPATLPPRLLLHALQIAPDARAHPFEVATHLRCGLERSHRGPHVDLVRELDDPSRGEVWTWWCEGHAPTGVAVLPDCPADNGLSGGDNDACTLYRCHPGGHSFECADPEYEALRTGPVYARLAAAIHARLAETDRTVVAGDRI
ncbi:hypothetical protein [Streptomyces katsurahamanus]|uniref:hypothetical protein n=1 Tax=Streptomyces katsurahamanus TaxID=2577098 RepID=UPI00188665AA|nr:hypothetical protein [Streptomyces katsurahamanus]